MPDCSILPQGRNMVYIDTYVSEVLWNCWKEKLNIYKETIKAMTVKAHETNMIVCQIPPF